MHELIKSIREHAYHYKDVAHMVKACTPNDPMTKDCKLSAVPLQKRHGL